MISSVVLLVLPETEVLTEELNNGLSITEGLFIAVIEFVECILESLITELACFLHVLHDLVVED
jgi:hypothetical protein